MAKEAVLQVRMDAELKAEAEALYRMMGTSLAEAVRIFARQSVIEQSMPFTVRSDAGEARGMAARYANPDLISREKEAFKEAMVKKYAKLD